MWSTYLSHRRTAKAQTSLRIRAVLRKPSLLACIIFWTKGHISHTFQGLCLRVWLRPLFSWDDSIAFRLVMFFSPFTAGICWMSADPRTRVCRAAFNLNLTREECCSISHIPSVSWTPEEHISRSRLFFINFLGGDEIRCQRCHSEWVIYWISMYSIGEMSLLWGQSVNDWHHCYLRIKICFLFFCFVFFYVHRVMKPVGWAKIPWSAKLDHPMSVKKSNFNSYIYTLLFIISVHNLLWL